MFWCESNKGKYCKSQVNTPFVLANKIFWKTVKPFFSNKGSYNVKLVEDDKLLQDDSKVAEELNSFFKEAISTLDINENSYIINPNSINISDPVEKAISINFIQALYSLMIR